MPRGAGWAPLLHCQNELPADTGVSSGQLAVLGFVITRLHDDKPFQWWEFEDFATANSGKWLERIRLYAQSQRMQ
jgi:hypothetical protein